MTKTTTTVVHERYIHVYIVSGPACIKCNHLHCSTEFPSSRFFCSVVAYSCLPKLSGICIPVVLVVVNSDNGNYKCTCSNILNVTNLSINFTVEKKHTALTIYDQGYGSIDAAVFK